MPVIDLTRSWIPERSRLVLRELMAETASVPGDVVEAGCYRCGTTAILAEEAAKRGKVVYAFDLWGGLPYGEEQTAFREFGDVEFEEVRRYISQWPNVELVRGRHEETVPAWEKRPLSLAFIDSDFGSSHDVCLAHFLPVLSPGGAVVFDDPAIGEVAASMRIALDAFGRERLEVSDDSGGMQIWRLKT